MYINMYTVCVPHRISSMERCTVTFLSLAQRALSGKLHNLLVEFLTQLQSGESSICLTQWFHVSCILCVYVSVSLVRSWEQNIILTRFFHQYKELCLASCTDCLTSSLLELKVVNIPFAFLIGFTMQYMKPHPPLAIPDTLF